jgi:hypothetical protein
VGVGDPLEAAYPLTGPVAAGTWHLVGDGIVFEAADVRYEVLWRTGGVDSLLVQFQHHFDPLTGANPFDATPFEADARGLGAPARAGDQLVLRFSAVSASQGTVFIPNGDGAKAHGRIPSLTLPQ